MSIPFKIACAQISSTVGDIQGNLNTILDYFAQAEKNNSDIVLFPELAITGYPPEDLIYDDSFIEANLEALDKIIDSTKTSSTALVVGFIDKEDTKYYNSAAFIYGGSLVYCHRKLNLPNYSVFDEKRYFTSSENPISSFSWRGINIALGVCEDLWIPEGWYVAAPKIDLVLGINASPYYIDKRKDRIEAVKTLSQVVNAPIVYSNSVGAQDELVFDGGSFAVNQYGDLLGYSPEFDEGLSYYDFNKQEYSSADFLEREHSIMQALVTGTRHYIHSNNFDDVVIGLSGGIDSAVVAYIAQQAIGCDKVHTVAMPSKFSSDASLLDAEKLALNLKLDHRILDINKLYHSYMLTLKDVFDDSKADVTEENIQARIRGNLLMSLSNKFGWMVLSTGNKSENAIGYSTLYGDMAGGFNPLKDVYKSDVYNLAFWINKYHNEELIPTSIIEKLPSAELSEDQFDKDAIPTGSYLYLDVILHRYIEGARSLKQIIESLPEAFNIKEEEVLRTYELVNKSEYKRRQSCPGPKITTRTLGKDRRMPISNKFKISIPSKDGDSLG